MLWRVSDAATNRYLLHRVRHTMRFIAWYYKVINVSYCIDVLLSAAITLIPANNWVAMVNLYS